MGEEGYIQRMGWLRKVTQFNSLNNHQLGTMSAAFEEVKYQPDDVIINEGDIGDAFYVIKSGEVKWETSAGETGTRKEGEYFGERALINHEKRAATVTAVKTTECLKLAKKDFEELLGPLVEKMKKQIKVEEAKSEEFKGARGSA